ncbi:hypothetical protein GGI20_005519 [Coemansia sp. BCRC 34301]|nr:hypothetical protein GGI20_005519 [Coemansia sp. BCRC 34301]
MDHLCRSIDQLVATQQILLACVEGSTTHCRVSSEHTADSGFAESRDNDSYTIEPPTHTRLNEIKRNVEPKAPTWANLRTATMAAYGIELLHMVIGGLRVNRGRPTIDVSTADSQQ